MSTITVHRENVTSEEVCQVLRDGLGDRYNVLPATGMGRSALQGPHDADPDTILVGTGSNRVVKAEVKIVPQGGQTALHISPGGLSWDLALNGLGIARKTRKVLAASPNFQ